MCVAPGHDRSSVSRADERTAWLRRSVRLVARRSRQPPRRSPPPLARGRPETSRQRNRPSRPISKRINARSAVTTRPYCRSSSPSISLIRVSAIRASRAWTAIREDRRGRRLCAAGWSTARPPAWTAPRTHAGRSPHPRSPSSTDGTPARKSLPLCRCRCRWRYGVWSLRLKDTELAAIGQNPDHVPARTAFGRSRP